MTEAEKLWLGRREFTYARQMSVDQDLFVMHHSRHAGLVGATMQEGETPDAFMKRLMDNLLSSGMVEGRPRALLLMGGLLLPKGVTEKTWSPDTAIETASVLGAISDPDEKRQLYVELASALLAFFASGLGSWIASASSSEGDVEAPILETGPGGSGPPSSAPSLDSTPTVVSLSPGGP